MNKFVSPTECFTVADTLAQLDDLNAHRGGWINVYLINGQSMFYGSCVYSDIESAREYGLDDLIANRQKDIMDSKEGRIFLEGTISSVLQMPAP